MLFVRVTCPLFLLTVNPALLWGSFGLGELNVVVYLSMSRPSGPIIGLREFEIFFSFFVSLIPRDDLSSIYLCCRLDLSRNLTSIPTTLRFHLSHDKYEGVNSDRITLLKYGFWGAY